MKNGRLWHCIWHCADLNPKRDYPLREYFNGLRNVVEAGNQWRLMSPDFLPLTCPMFCTREIVSVAQL